MMFIGVPVLEGYLANIELRASGLNMELLLRQQVNHEDTVRLDAAENENCVPIGFDPNPTDERLKAAVHWILHDDVQAMDLFLAGSTIRQLVPSGNPRPISYNPDNQQPSEYWALRQTSGALIRPLLLLPPSMEYLRGFQQQGVDWLLEHEKGILADDMGLGKTVQSISAMRSLFHSGRVRRALVVTPKSLSSNWSKELSHWAPELSHTRLSPTTSRKEQVWADLLGRIHIILTNYEHLRESPEAIQKYGIDLVICDEAHRIRNARSRVARGIRELSSRYFWALSGTPLERDSEDMATLLATLHPKRFSVSDKDLHVTSLRSQIRPYMLRRLKSDVLDELPDVIDTTISLDLLPRQRASYNKAIKQLHGVDHNQVLSVVNRLRTICDYDDASSDGCKVQRILEIIDSIARTGDKAVVFSYLLKPLEILREKSTTTLGPGSSEVLTGDMPISERNMAISRFQNDAEKVLLLASSRVGGEGLNLVEANHVIFFNEWWNPSANNQARDRVVRIGQKKAVSVYRFRCVGTIEERFDEILKTKSEATYELVDKLSESGPLNTDDLAMVVSGLKGV